MMTYPNQLLILFPIYQPVDYRQRLVAIDDALVVHRRGDGAYLFELRPLTRLTGRGRHSAAAALIRLAGDLERGYTVVIVERDRFLGDLEARALASAPARDRAAVERAAQVIAERTRFQIRNHVDGEMSQYRANCQLIAARPRRTKVERNKGNSLNWMYGIPTPRAEQLWHAIHYELTDVRSNQAGTAAWEQWCAANRPDGAVSLTRTALHTMQFGL